jgi:RecA/RadA recombinase
MAKAFDVSKFRKEITKSIEGLSIGFNDPTDWISTGNFALNYLISGDFNKGIPLGKVTVFAGESGAGKSYICSGNIIKNAQEQGIYVVLVDSENALDEAWLKALGVDTGQDKLLKLSMSMIDDVAKTISVTVSTCLVVTMWVWFVPIIPTQVKTCLTQMTRYQVVKDLSMLVALWLP